MTPPEPKRVDCDEGIKAAICGGFWAAQQACVVRSIARFIFGGGLLPFLALAAPCSFAPKRRMSGGAIWRINVLFQGLFRQ